MQNAVPKSGPETTILIVDDDPAMRGLVKAALRASRYEVVTARDGQEALHLLNRSTVDLIVCDIQMPEMDGLELGQKLWEQQRYVPVLYISAAAPATLPRAFLRKPFRHDELVGKVRELLGY